MCHPEKKTSYHILTVTVAQQSVAECQLNFLFKYTGNVICFSNVYNNSPLQLYYKSFLETGIIVFFFFFPRKLESFSNRNNVNFMFRNKHNRNLHQSFQLHKVKLQLHTAQALY